MNEEEERKVIVLNDPALTVVGKLTHPPEVE